MGLATGMYISAGLGSGPRDGLMAALSARYGVELDSAGFNLYRIEGSRLAFSIPGGRMKVRFGDTPAAAEGDEHVVRTSGYFSVEVDGQTERRLIPLTAVPDRRPSVRIERPGKDLLIAAGDRTVPITAVASDDFGLRSLELRFTKVTGSGDPQ